MKRFFFLSIVLTLIACQQQPLQAEKPRVFVFTDININSGDPDDRQSLIHLLWYADELQIEGVVPDRWEAKGYEACQQAVEAYRKDYSQFDFSEKGYPPPETIEAVIATDKQHAISLFQEAVSDTSSPLYVLVWGNMRMFGEALLQEPEQSDNIRLITIATGLMLDQHIPEMPPDWERSEPCKQLNWNGFGRNEIYNDPQFNQMWWLEMNWAYAGMFTGEEPAEMFSRLTQYGKLGMHIKEVVKHHSWAQYFRVGDTPSVLYVIDSDHNIDQPVQSSWAGKYTHPFPSLRPNYYTDYVGEIEWNYGDPCQTWENYQLAEANARSTLESRRPEMYQALLDKLDSLYAPAN